MDYVKAQSIAQFISDKTTIKPEIAIVLGSGLGDFVSEIDVKFSLPYEQIPDFPHSTVAGHSGKLVLGELFGKQIIIMQGRVHYYEGYSMCDVTLPIVALKLLGVQKIILTNSAGGINPKLSGGALMQITDHITSFVPSPLIGKNDDRLGERFPDMSYVYDREFVDIIDKVSSNLNIPLQRGVYLQTTGPNFETPAEINMFKILGADVVGMSTAVEAMVANYLGMRVCGLSCISNMASGISTAKLTHAEVLETAKKVAKTFILLLKNVVNNI